MDGQEAGSRSAGRGPPNPLGDLPVLGSFAEIADTERYAPLPDDWIVGLADVVGSTEAIARGDYKAVNMAGAAVISAVSNALGSFAFPFAFGGDGASFVVPPEAAPAARRALAATAALVGEELGLALRVGALPVAAIRVAGLDLRVARFVLSPELGQAMFAGGGLAWAEARLKDGLFGLEPTPGARPDLRGLSCRFEPIRTRRGVILSLIVRSTGRDDARYRGLLAAILAAVDASPGMARPVPEAGPPLTWPAPGLAVEAALAGRSSPLRRAWLYGRSLLAFLVLRLRIPIGRFRPTRYLAELVAHSDYRKYDDGLRMTIDCDERLAAALEETLATAAAAGIAEYGLHRQASALLTCLSPSPATAQHIHFVDGAAGGYATAAAALKARAAGRMA